MSEFKNVCIVGLGEVGYPTAKYLAEKGIKVFGYDVSKNAVKKAKNAIKATDDWNTIPHDEISVYVVCVSTGIRNNTPDMSAIFDACKKIAAVAKNNPLVSITSTVSLGTCRRLMKLFRNPIDLVYAPHRYWKKNPVRYGVKQPRVIGGINKNSLKRGLDFYSKLDIPMFPVSSIELAEMSKIAEQSYRYVQIAFAEELKLICDENGLNFEKLREACNTKWNVEILEARDGIGGRCLPKDMYYLLSCSDTPPPLLRGSIAADEIYKRRKGSP